MKPKYRIRPYDFFDDSWILDERRWFLFIPYWWPVGCASKKQAQAKCDELNAAPYKATPSIDTQTS